LKACFRGTALLAAAILLAAGVLAPTISFAQYEDSHANPGVAYAGDTQRPQAAVTVADITSAGGDTHILTVVYTDNAAVSLASIDSSDICVTGPYGVSQPGILIGVDASANGSPITATYRINAPGGLWDEADNGVYTVFMYFHQVSDTSGIYVQSGYLTDFTVNIGDYAILTNTNQHIIAEGQQATFQVKLNKAPAGDLTVSVSRHSGDTDISVVSGLSLQFNPSNWNTWQTVTMRAAFDEDLTNGQAIIRCSAPGWPYKNVQMTEVDFGPGIVTNTSTHIIGEGCRATFQVRLGRQPSSNITVHSAWVSGDSDISVVAGASLVFTPENWNIRQSVMVRAAFDADAINGQAVIRCSTLNWPSKNVTMTEVDSGIGIVTNTIERGIGEGRVSTFQVKLSGPPTGNLTVNSAWLSGDPDISVIGGAALVFTPSNWKTWQTVNLYAALDADTENGQAVIRCSAIDYPNRDVTVIERDSGLLIVTNTTSRIVGEDCGASFQVRLNTPPDGNVTVSTSRISGDTDIAVVSGSTLLFTPLNWNVWQSVLVRAAEDADALNGQAVVRCSAPGWPNRNVTITEVDNDINSASSATKAVDYEALFREMLSEEEIPLLENSLFMNNWRNLGMDALGLVKTNDDQSRFGGAAYAVECAVPLRGLLAVTRLVPWNGTVLDVRPTENESVDTLLRWRALDDGVVLIMLLRRAEANDPETGEPLFIIEMDTDSADSEGLGLLIDEANTRALTP
jgi:hypothetical protein